MELKTTTHVENASLEEVAREVLLMRKELDFLRERLAATEAMVLLHVREGRPPVAADESFGLFSRQRRP